MTRNHRHAAVMAAVLKSIGQDTLVLKGGAALILAYDLDRESADLDFDSKRKVRDIEAKIRSTSIPDTQITKIDLLKDTPTVTRYRVGYITPEGEGSLKVEISYRNPVPESEVRVKNGIRVADLGRILDQKLLAAYDGDRPRTRARDLYDIEFIIRTHPEVVTADLAERVCGFSADPSLLAEQYGPAFEEDGLDADVESIALRLNDHAERIRRRLQNERSGRDR